MLKQKVKYHDLKLIDYKEAWDYQENIHRTLVERKINMQNNQSKKENFPANHFILCEHPHVYTLGKNGEANNLLINDDILKRIKASFYKTNRGGDITYHGPGQIVGYPIFDLDRLKLSIKDFIYYLEETIIQTLLHFHIRASRLKGATGVWLDIEDDKKVRKICAIGVRVSRLVTMHGLALNVNTDLNYFNYIHPCGFITKGVTSIQQETGIAQDIEQIKNVLKTNISAVFNMDINE